MHKANQGRGHVGYKRGHMKTPLRVAPRLKAVVKNRGIKPVRKTKQQRAVPDKARGDSETTPRIIVSAPGIRGIF